MKDVFIILVYLGIIFSGSRLALIKAHDTMKYLAEKKIKQGLSSTEAFNRHLWSGGKSNYSPGLK